MLSHPPKTPVLKSERQIAGKIVTRLLHSSPDDTLRVPTGGKVTCGIPLLNRVAWFQGSYSFTAINPNEGAKGNCPYL